ncbi:MAG: FecR family protein, partial [Bacteroidota bacterium]|nr:FecR family protein [Bacteroidota bacterium]
MQKEIFDIDQLIASRLLGTITRDDDQLLDDWITEKVENLRYFSEQKRLWNLFEMHQKMQKIDERKAYQKISAQLFKPKRINLFAYIQRIAAILLLPVIIVSAYYIFSEETDRKQLAMVYNTAETPLGMRSSLILPDGTKVWLNAGSKISYPILFSDKFRAVKLEGEAYFEVVKDKKW